MTRYKVSVLGAGLVGSLMSVFLARQKHYVDLYEKRPDMRKVELDGGRSINLALSHRGLKALEQVGLRDQILKICLPMKGRMMHDLNGNLTFQRYGKESQYINSVSRAQLNISLMDAAESQGVTIHFGEKCTGIDFDAGVASFKSKEGKHQQTSEWIIGADGAFSRVRRELRKTDRFNFSQYYLDHGYKELCIPPKNGEFAMDPGALHIWPREQFMLIALPNLDKSFTCTLFLPFEGVASFEALQEKDQITGFFEREFPDALPLMPTLLEDFRENPTASLVTIRCDPWFRGKAFLIGDASHAIVPFYGQGMNAGFEDCRLLNEALINDPHDWDTAFKRFQDERIPNANAIADLAFQNFIEMRDLVADKEFLLRKRIEQVLHEKFPEDWVPLYSMVTFSDTPYARAQYIGQIQQQIMDDFLQQPGIHEKWETMDLSPLIKSLKARVPEP